MSDDIAVARRERDLDLTRQPSRSLEALQKEGREKWLTMRAERLAQGGAAERGHCLEAERQKAIERWREYRRDQALGKGGDGPEIE